MGASYRQIAAITLLQLLMSCKGQQASIARTNGASSEEAEKEYSGTGEAAAVSGTNLLNICNATTSGQTHQLDCNLMNCIDPGNPDPKKCKVIFDRSQVALGTNWTLSAKENAATTALTAASVSCVSDGVRIACSHNQGFSIVFTKWQDGAKTNATQSITPAFGLENVSSKQIAANTDTRLRLEGKGFKTGAAVKLGSGTCAVVPPVTETVINCDTGKLTAAASLALQIVQESSFSKEVSLAVSENSATPTNTPTATPTPTPPGGSHYVFFVSNTPFDGPSVGGLALADTHCTIAGSAAGGGSWTALLSTTANDARDLMTQDGIPLKDVTGFTFAANKSALFNGILIGPLRRDESGNTLSTPTFVWTGSLGQGIFDVLTGAADSTCSDWLPAGNMGIVGRADVTTNFVSAGTSACNAMHRLYCFQLR